jgi:glycosyltransferase involved in cell wall biosynthesis
VKSVTLSSYYNFTSGYGEVLRVLIENLPQNGYNIIPRTYSIISSEFLQCFENSKNVDPNLLDFSLLSLTNDLGSSNIFLQMDFSRPRVLYTMWESTRVNDLMIEVLNKYRHICVPNHYNKNNFINQGLTAKIDVIPLFCDTNFFTYKEHIPNKKFVFGISNEDPRKNLAKVTKCFLKAFKGYNNVELHVKTNEVIQKTFDNKIKYVSQRLSKSSLRDWYYNIDVYLSGATCEGWGMMQQESMCCGRPIIYTNYGGLSEFVKKENNFEVGYDEVYSENYWGDYGGKWSEFKEDEFMEMMKYCYDNQEIVVSKGKQASEDACIYTKEAFIKNISKVIDLYIKYD